MTQRTCRKCRKALGRGIALQQTYRRSADFVGDFPGRGVTMSAGGPGKIVECLKCPECGWSTTVEPEEVKD